MTDTKYEDVVIWARKMRKSMDDKCRWERCPHVAVVATPRLIALLDAFLASAPSEGK